MLLNACHVPGIFLSTSHATLHVVLTATAGLQAVWLESSLLTSLEWLEQQKLYLHAVWRLESEIEVSSEPCSLGRPYKGSFLASWSLQVVAGSPWCPSACWHISPSLCLHLHTAFSPECVSVWSFLLRTPVIGFRTRPSSIWLCID